MRLNIQDFDGKFNARNLVTSKEISLDLLTALNCIKDSDVSLRLRKAMDLVSLANKNVPKSKEIGPAQLKIDRCNYILGLNDSCLYTTRLAINIVRKGKSSYSFKQLSNIELIFKKENDSIVSLISKEYTLTPNGIDEKGEIILSGGNHSVDTLIHKFKFSEDIKEHEINKATLFALVDNQNIKDILNKFDFEKVDSVANIKMIEKHSNKDLKKGIKDLAEKIGLEFDALDSLKDARFNWDNFSSHDEQKVEITDK